MSKRELPMNTEATASSWAFRGREMQGERGRRASAGPRVATATRHHGSQAGSRDPPTVHEHLPWVEVVVVEVRKVHREASNLPRQALVGPGAPRPPGQQLAGGPWLVPAACGRHRTGALSKRVLCAPRSHVAMATGHIGRSVPDPPMPYKGAGGF